MIDGGKVNMDAVPKGLRIDVARIITGGKEKGLDPGDVDELQKLLTEKKLTGASRDYVQNFINAADAEKHKEIEDNASKEGRDLVKRIRKNVPDFKKLNEDEAQALLHELDNPIWSEYDVAYFKDVLKMEGYGNLVSDADKSKDTATEQKDATKVPPPAEQEIPKSKENFTEPQDFDVAEQPASPKDNERAEQSIIAHNGEPAPVDNPENNFGQKTTSETPSIPNIIVQKTHPKKPAPETPPDGYNQIARNIF